VFVEFFDPLKNCFNCLNSNGPKHKPRPRVLLETPGIVLYTIFCKAKEIGPFDLRNRISGNLKRKAGESSNKFMEERNIILTNNGKDISDEEDLRNKLNRKNKFRVFTENERAQHSVCPPAV